jgi:hypothetical protein
MSLDVIRALQGKDKLCRVVLEGDWCMTEASLTTFVQDHAPSLYCLILYGIVLNGK